MTITQKVRIVEGVDGGWVNINTGKIHKNAALALRAVRRRDLKTARELGQHVISTITWEPRSTLGSAVVQALTWNKPEYNRIVDEDDVEEDRQRHREFWSEFG